MMKRRDFVKQSLGAAGVLGFGVPVKGKGLNERIQHAAIGVSGMGRGDLANIASHKKVQIVALCDVDGDKLAKAAEKHPEARLYRDWREMLVKEGDQIDSVNVTTPDHMHAPISLAAMKRGKHVYCQKPLTRQISEARRMAEVAAKHGVITQMGNQIHSHIAYRMGVAWIQGGAIGKVKAVHSWVNAKFPQQARPKVADPVPGSINWDHWLGVAPERPYNAGIYHPFKWRGWQDFGGGGIGDFGCHILDPVFTALELRPAKVTIEAEVDAKWRNDPARFKESWPDWEIFQYTINGSERTAGDTLPITWYDGGKKPPAELAPLPEGQSLPAGGSLILGEKGAMLLPHVAGPRLLPAPDFEGYAKPDIPKNVNHYHSWVDACLAGKQTSDNFAYAGPLSEVVLLGTLAARFPGERLVYDAKKMAVTNHAAANVFVNQPWREGWEV